MKKRNKRRIALNLALSLPTLFRTHALTSLLIFASIFILCFSQPSVSKQKHSTAELTRLAINNNAEAQYLLAYRYEMGKTVKRSFKEAINWYKKAARKKHRDAQYRVGILYYKQKQFTKARYWLSKRAKAGHSDAQYYLANTYRYALGTREQTTTSRKWYTKAAKQGHAKAQYELGMLYQNGIGAKQSANTANKWFKLAAKNGVTKANAQLNKTTKQMREKTPVKHHIERKTPPPPVNSDQQYELGMRYLIGYQINVNPQRAIHWLSKAAEQNHPLAQYQLASQHMTGNYVKKDLTEAIRYFSAAAKQQVQMAKTALRHLSENGFETAVKTEDGH